MTSPAPGVPLAYLVLDPGGSEITYPVLDRLFIGRECAGIDESRRVLIPDDEVSRSHAELRLDAAGDRAYLVDESANGTRLNGARIPRAVPTPVRPGDRIGIGDRTFEFRSHRFAGQTSTNIRETSMPIRLTEMAMVVGDIISYSTISQVTDNNTIAVSLQRLWAEMGAVLSAHKGTLSNYAGDALYAVWDPTFIPDATQQAIDFALDADRLLQRLAPELALRNGAGEPIQMGWAVVHGSVAVAPMTRTDTVIGDATNLAFRLSGIAGRDGRARVVVTSGIRNAVGDAYSWGEPEQVDTKGRTGKETIYPVFGRVEGRA